MATFQKSQVEDVAISISQIISSFDQVLHQNSVLERRLRSYCGVELLAANGNDTRHHEFFDGTEPANHPKADDAAVDIPTSRRTQKFLTMRQISPSSNETLLSAALAKFLDAPISLEADISSATKESAVVRKLLEDKGTDTQSFDLRHTADSDISEVVSEAIVEVGRDSGAFEVGLDTTAVDIGQESEILSAYRTDTHDSQNSHDVHNIGETEQQYQSSIEADRIRALAMKRKSTRTSIRVARNAVVSRKPSEAIHRRASALGFLADAVVKHKSESEFSRTRQKVNIKELIRRNSLESVKIGPEPTSLEIARQRLWNLFERPHAGLRNQLFNVFFNILIIMSVCSPVAATTNISSEFRYMLLHADLVFTILFTIEILIKLVCCPNKRVFLCSLYTIIDFVVVIAGFIGTAFPDTKNMYLRLLATQLPILRLLKVSKHSTGWRLLVVSISQCAAPLLVPMYLLALMVFFSGSLQFWLDQNFCCTGNGCAPSEGPAFESIPHAMWFVIVTVSTVGYGDVVPRSVPGKVLASIQIVAGICYMAMPLTIIGNNFTHVWDDRHRLLIRDMLTKSSNHMDLTVVKRIFDAFDPDRSGYVTLAEFILFIESMQIDLSKRGIRALFDAIDLDRSNQLTFYEFADFLFPDGYDPPEE